MRASGLGKKPQKFRGGGSKTFHGAGELKKEQPMTGADFNQSE